MVATLEAPAPAPSEAAPSQGIPEGANGKEKPKRKWNGVYVQTPDALREKLEAVAQADSKSPAQYIRDHFASMWGITLPPIQKRTKYASDEEKKAALTAKRKERQELIAMLLKQHREALAASGQAPAA